MQKIQGIYGSWGYKGGKPWGQRHSGACGSQPTFWFILFSLTSRLSYTERPFPVLQKSLFFFFFISRSRRANMVPGQLQPQLLLDQCLTEESRSSGLRSPRPLPKLIKTWTPILSGEMHWPRTPLLPWRWQAAGSAPQTLPRGLPEGRPPRGEGRDALRHQPALCRAQTRLPKPGAQGHLRMNSSARLPDRQADFKGALRHCPLKDPKDPRNSIGVSNRIKMFQQLSLLLK